MIVYYNLKVERGNLHFFIFFLDDISLAMESLSNEYVLTFQKDTND